MEKKLIKGLKEYEQEIKSMSLDQNTRCATHLALESSLDDMLACQNLSDDHNVMVVELAKLIGLYKIITTLRGDARACARAEILDMIQNLLSLAEGGGTSSNEREIEAQHIAELEDRGIL
jgi:hypothetical protein